MRVLLLHILNSDKYRIARDQHFPFLRAALTAGGVAVRRVFVGLPEPSWCGDERLVFEVPSGDLEGLVELVEAWRPDGVVLNERLEEETFERLALAAGGRERVLLAQNSWPELRRDLTRRLRIPAHILGSARVPLEYRLAPDCAGEPFNEASTRARPLVHLLLGRTCSYRPKVKSNPFFKRLDLGELRGHRGCSFCSTCNERVSEPRPRDLLRITLRQLAASIATLNSEVQDREFLVRGTRILERLDELAAEMQARAMPSCVLHLSCRLDELLRAAPAVERALETMSKSGHRLVLCNVGIENFSPVENLRFNKGLEPHTIEVGLALLERLTKTYPDSFDFPGFGFILFTPWTTFDDLRVNIREARRLGVSHPFSQFCLGTALQLLTTRPIAKLAAADGHASFSYTFEDCSLDSGCVTSWDDGEMPWRFADSRVGRVFFFARRFGPHRDVPAEDPFVPSVRAYRGAVARLAAGAADPLMDFEAILETVESAPDPDDVDAIMERALELVMERVGSASGEGTRVVALELLPSWRRAAKSLEALPQRELMALGVSLAALNVFQDRHGPRMTARLVGPEDELEMVLERAREGCGYFMTEGPVGAFYRARDASLSEAEVLAMRHVLSAVVALLES